jgi:hypothetical protein
MTTAQDDGKVVSLSSPFTGLEWPRRFQEVKVPRFHDNGTGMVVRLSDLAVPIQAWSGPEDSKKLRFQIS